MLKGHMDINMDMWRERYRSEVLDKKGDALDGQEGTLARRLSQRPRRGPAVIIGQRPHLASSDQELQCCKCSKRLGAARGQLGS